MQIEAKLQALGIVMPEAPKIPPGIKISFAWTRVRGNRVYVTGHAAQNPDGSPAGPFGKVPSEVSLEQAQAAARGPMVGVPATASIRHTQLRYNGNSRSEGASVPCEYRGP